MSSTYQIADAAQRSGLTATTLRYYEQVGLLAPAGRTEAGYRLYDDGSLERLRFIARAKQLGCTLGEVRDLAEAWEAGECGPVQDRLLPVVEAKLAETHGRIAELTALAADLQRAAAALSTHRPEGPCDDACGCTSDPPPPGTPGTPTAVDLTVEPEWRATGPEPSPPIACTLGADDMSYRLDEWNALLTDERVPLAGVTARRPLEDGVRLELGPGTDVGEIARLAVAEQSCCRFFRFALVIDGRGAALEVRAPAEAADAVTALFGAAR
jgi:MerR family transcriptional regulator, copper efflux regulator